MTTETLTAVSNEELLDLADKLEASACIMHGSAYQPARQGYRIMRLMAESREMDDEDIALLQKLIPEMRYFSETIHRPGSDRMKKAASLIEQVLQEHTQRAS